MQTLGPDGWLAQDFSIKFNAPCRLTRLGCVSIVSDSEGESAVATARRFLFRQKRLYEFRTHHNAGPAGA
jgi:hypothetical protein